MDESSQRLIEDCFLRPISDVKTTNVTNVPPPSKVPVKTELHVLRLSEESQKITLETLRAIRGPDFELDDHTKYKDRGTGFKKKAYWDDRGTLMVLESTSNIRTKDDNPQDRLKRFAIMKLESYGFPTSHCVEAYDHCEGNVDSALMLLYRKYMFIPENPVPNELAENLSNDDLLEMLNDEKEALKSIYDQLFEEKELNTIWSLKFQIQHLLVYSPSEKRKAREAEAAAAEALLHKKKPPTNRCRNFDRNGTCRYGQNCRFAHISKDPEEKKEKNDENENEKWFYLEIRFPPNSKYPYEAPYVFLKTTCYDIPSYVLLRLCRRLYRDAHEMSVDGMPCIYTICENLQNEESIARCVHEDSEAFPNPDKSLFHVDSGYSSANNSNSRNSNLPTHYERGQTSMNDNYTRDLARLESDNRWLLRRYVERQKEPRYMKMISGRKKLPAFEKMHEILELIRNSQVVVISGETGCGKSTQVPQFILDDWFNASSQLDSKSKMPHVEVICTQPRRLSTIGVAERVADERADTIGQLVGYQIRLENKISSKTRLNFCTTGILLRRLASDPFLKSVTHIIIDEVHERSIESDFLLMILRRILPVRPDLKIILMSATLNANLFSNYFGGIPIIDIPGRTFNVEQMFLDDILEKCDYVMEPDSQFSRKLSKKEAEDLMEELEYADTKAQNVAPPVRSKDELLNLAGIYARYSECSKKTCKTIYLVEPMKVNTELIESVLKYIVEEMSPKEGSILIFLPGLQEIQAVYEALCDNVLFSPRSNQFVIVPLHSTLTTEEQSAVFRPAPKGKRKIVLSTNIAETSITIDDCVYVIDTGLMKEKRFDPNRNMESLELTWVSRANAMQRKGRAGRVMEGHCIHLYTRHRFQHNFLAQPVPEIQRVPLEQLVLRIKTLPNFENENVIEVLGGMLEPPTEENIMAAVTRLRDVGALDEDQIVTPLGLHLAALPVDVRIGKLMLFGAIFQCLDSVLTIAACLSHKSPFVSPFNKREEAQKRKKEFAICNSDHLTCLVAYRKWLEVSRRSYMASRNYADEHFLSLNTLQTLAEVKYQFLELLVSIGFVPINVPRKPAKFQDKILELTGPDLNKNGMNNRLLISLLCSALYPNIVKILTPERSYVQTAAGALPKQHSARDLRFKTNLDGYISLHPSSINADVGNFQTPFLVFQEKVKTSRIFIRECTMLPIISLVLFAGSDLRIELHNGEFLILLEDGWLVLKAFNHDTAEMIRCLRDELQKILADKISDPCLNLLNHENGRRIIQNIAYLVNNNN